jgi:hypothetical protein
MMQSLERNAEHRRKYGVRPDPDLPPVEEDDRFSIRLAALLHDVGHSTFSHATEPLIEERGGGELSEISELLLREFEVAHRVKPSEAVAVLILLSEPLKRVFGHARFRVPFSSKDQLPQTVCARILGSRRYLRAPYLSGIISGPIDADKLDYMARDSYFTGLPIGLDVDRLISKLEIITITPDNVNDPDLRERAEATANKRLYQLGVSLSGLTAYEQMIVGRVLLYDRVYYHHKVRCGEAMARRLFEVAEEERGRPFSVSELLSSVPDDAMIYLLGGEMKAGEIQGGGDRSAKLGRAIGVRHFYHRAYAFAERFIAGLDGLDEEEEATTRSALWMDLYEGVQDRALARDIFELAKKLMETIPELDRFGAHLGPEHVLVDVADEMATLPGPKLLVRTESGVLTNANLFFNPEKWSNAYRNQKQCGYVFAPREVTEAVSLASQIIFEQRFGVVMRSEAQHLCKIDHLLAPNFKRWMDLALEAGLCSPECFNGLTQPTARFLRIREHQIRVPPEWNVEDPGLTKRLEQEFFNSLPGGLIASTRDAVVGALESLCYVLDVLEKQGTFVSEDRPDEKRRLQAEVLKVLRARGVQADEGTEISGGEADVILPGKLVLENKVAGQTEDPRAIRPDAAWQARRYAIALNRRVSFVLVAYKPADDAAILPLPSRVSVHPLPGSKEICAVVRLLVPWGHRTPSKARAPAVAGEASPATGKGSARRE